METQTRPAQEVELVGAILAASALMWLSSVPQQPPRTGRPVAAIACVTPFHVKTKNP